MSAISVFEMFKIGVGPSSSHTLGPWRAAEMFVAYCHSKGIFNEISSVDVIFFGSLAKTGRGHGTNFAVLMGLSGFDPTRCESGSLPILADKISKEKILNFGGNKPISFDPRTDILFNKEESLAFHPNGMRFQAKIGTGEVFSQEYFSIGGGFVVQEGVSPDLLTDLNGCYLYDTAADVEQFCNDEDLDLVQLAMTNELVWRTEAEVNSKLEDIFNVMRTCIYDGCHTSGILPGGLLVKRRAADLSLKLLANKELQELPIDEWFQAIKNGKKDFDHVLTWVSCFALAVNEQNAAYGRVVTAPTNGAAGVIPAVLFYYECFVKPGSDRTWRSFLLVSSLVGTLFKKRATISAAMGGCQAEIGVSSAMAAAGLTYLQGGSTAHCFMAAEIAMEHHLGLTCDPIGGLVQVPCIERNTMGAVKAITATQIALASDPNSAKVSLDAVIHTMWETAQDMNQKYKETSEGGLATGVPVSLSEC